jgi:hypothetical protein
VYLANRKSAASRFRGFFNPPSSEKRNSDIIGEEREIVADRIADSFSKKNENFDDYDKKIKADFCGYLIRRNCYYNLEKRWRNNTF